MNSTSFAFPRHTTLTEINSKTMVNKFKVYIVVMVTMLNSFHTGCFDPIPGSVEIHLFIFVIDVCLKSLPCSFIETLATLTGTEH